ncbi:MAG: SagB/ThcOx family dehydrogenase [Myxococcota bacterium]|jgi:SagB-type dehydrogenase family enzyme
MKSNWIVITLLSLFLIATAQVSHVHEAPAADGGATAHTAIKLPPPKTDGGIPLNRALSARRSIRELSPDPIPLDYAGELLWAAQGVTDDNGHRTAPSAMGLYLLDTYLIAANVTGLASGLYKYSPAGHEITLVSAGDKRAEILKKAVKQYWISNAPVMVILVGVPERITKRGGEKGVKWMYVEAGLAAENFFLEAVSLGMASTYVGSFDADALRDFLGLPKSEEPVAVLPVGFKR